MDFVKKSNQFNVLTVEERTKIILANPIPELLQASGAKLLAAAPIENDKPSVIAGNANASLEGVSDTHKQYWQDIDLYAQLVAQVKGAKRGTDEYMEDYLDAVLVCGVSVSSNQEQTFRSSANQVTLSQVCIDVMGKVAGGKVSDAIQVAVKGMRDDPNGYSVFSSSSSSETGQGYGMSAIEQNDNITGKININSFSWTATDKKTDWFWAKRDSTTVKLKYHVIIASLNYKAYESIKDQIEKQINSYRTSLIVQLPVKNKEAIA